MARYDKYDPYDGGFRAPLAAAILLADGYKTRGVGLDANGRVVFGAGQTGIVGVLIPNGARAAGAIVDVMTDGEIVEAKASDDVTALAAGTVYYAAAGDGTISTTNTGTRLGHTVEADRLIVRVAR